MLGKHPISGINDERPSRVIYMGTSKENSRGGCFTSVGKASTRGTSGGMRTPLVRKSFSENTSEETVDFSGWGVKTGEAVLLKGKRAKPEMALVAAMGPFLRRIHLLDNPLGPAQPRITSDAQRQNQCTVSAR